MNPIIQKLGMLIAMLSAFLSASAYDFEVDGIYYNIVDESAKEAAVTYRSTFGDSYSGDISIPSSVTKDNVIYSVTSIGESAFYYCPSLASITIPNSVTSIGPRAFENCSSLTSITIPNSVTSIGYYAFVSCSSLTSITLPNSVTSIEYGAFQYCSSLASITLPNSVTSIRQYTFANCSSLTSITLPNSVTSIGDQAFYGCSLYSITFGSRFASIGSDAFSSVKKAFWLADRPPSGASDVNASVNYVTNSQYKFANQKVYPFLSSRFEVDGVIYVPVSLSDLTCHVIDCNYNLTSTDTDLIIPASVTKDNVKYSVTSIEKYAFYNCYWLKSIAIPDNITSIGEYTFSGCTGLTSITLPKNVTLIGESAFSNCTGLTSITLPNSVTLIGESAFNGCTGLTSITLPNSVTSIGDQAFSSCSGLTSITLPNSVTSIGRGTFNGCSGLTSITLPNSVTSIGDQAFYGCSRLYSITLGSGLTSISSTAFSSCSIKKAFWLADTPPTRASDVNASVNYVTNSQYNLSNQKIYPFLSSRFDVDNVIYAPVSLSDLTCHVIDCNYNLTSTDTDLIIPASVTKDNVKYSVTSIDNGSVKTTEVIEN